MKLQKEMEVVPAITAFFTLHTCGEACWYAKEDLCHCCCAGKNHGCLKTGTGISPMRMAKIDGHMYQLKGFGKYGEMLGQAEVINKAKGPCRVDKVTGTLTYTYYWQETSPGAPARVKTIPYDTLQRWSEFKQFHGMTKQDVWILHSGPIYGLWVKFNPEGYLV